MVDEDTVYVTLPDGQTYKSDPASASGLEDYKLSDISFAADTSESNGSDSSAYRLRYADGSIDYYTQQGEILRQTDRYGNAITYYYTEADGLRRLTKIIDTADRAVTLSYNDTATTIRYDNRSITLQKTQVSGVTGKYVLSAYVDEAGRRTTYAYSYDSATFDLLGKTAATNTYANLMEIRYPTDLKTCYAYTTSAKNLADGHMQYGKVSRRWDQYEGVRYNLQKYFYRNEPDGYPLYKSDEIDEFYTYGSNVVNEDGTTVRYIYNFKHLLQSTATVSDDGTEIQRIKYDVNRNVPVYVETSVKTDSSFVKSIDTYSYDIRGNLIKENHPVEPDDLNSGEYATTYTYDSLYNLMLTKTYKQDKDTTITVQYTLSEDRMNSIAEDIFSNGDRLQSTTYDYDSCGNLIESAVRMGENEWAVTRYEYGSEYRYVYPTTVTAVDVEDADGGRHNVTQRYTYDLYTGDVLTSTDGNGYTTSYSYDDLGRVLQETLPDGLKRSYTYDDRRNTVVETDANGNSFVYTYDAFGHLSNVKDKETGAVLTSKEYDNRENVSAETDGNGSRTEYAYDTRNRLISTTVYGSDGRPCPERRLPTTKTTPTPMETPIH